MTKGGSAPGPAATSIDPKQPIEELVPSPPEDAYGGRSRDDAVLREILAELRAIKDQNAQIMIAFNGIADGVGSITSGNGGVLGRLLGE